jgi:hypothetical protein
MPIVQLAPRSRSVRVPAPVRPFAPFHAHRLLIPQLVFTALGDGLHVVTHGRRVKAVGGKHLVQEFDRQPIGLPRGKPRGGVISSDPCR